MKLLILFVLISFNLIFSGDEKVSYNLLTKTNYFLSNPNSLKEKYKIVVLDTGANMGHELLRPYRSLNQEKISEIDYLGHGTHVAGIIASNLNKTLGKWAQENIEIISVKYLQSASPESMLDFQNALKKAIELNPQVINISAYGYETSENELNLIKNNSQITFVVASGNENKNLDETPSYPCGYNLNNVVCVGSLGFNSFSLPYSNKGKVVRYYAQGENILSSTPNGYGEITGTSQSTPLVVAMLITKKFNKDRMNLLMNRVVYNRESAKKLAYLK